MVSCRPRAKATFSLVPTPSTLETSTGRLYFLVSSANKPPHPPTLPSTSRRWVEASSCGRVALTRLLRPVLTPAGREACAMIGGLGASLRDGDVVHGRS